MRVRSHVHLRITELGISLGGKRARLRGAGGGGGCAATAVAVAALDGLSCHLPLQDSVFTSSGCLLLGLQCGHQGAWLDAACRRDGGHGRRQRVVRQHLRHRLPS